MGKKQALSSASSPKKTRDVVGGDPGVEVECENPPLPEGMEVYEPEDAEGCIAGAVQHPRIKGIVEGVPCIAADTCGDGTCALHATWGRADPSKGMELYYAHGRASLLASLPTNAFGILALYDGCLLYTSPSPRDRSLSRMPSSA